jgi:hypothetical protein
MSRISSRSRARLTRRPGVVVVVVQGSGVKEWERGCGYGERVKRVAARRFDRGVDMQTTPAEDEDAETGQGKSGRSGGWRGVEK